MKDIMLKIKILVVLLLCGCSTFAQTIEFDRFEMPEIPFRIYFNSSYVEDTVQCSVPITLIYKQINYLWNLLEFQVGNTVTYTLIGSKTVFKFPKEISSIVSETVKKYVNILYRNEDRMLSGFELDTMMKYRHFFGKVKMITSETSIFICPKGGNV